MIDDLMDDIPHEIGMNDIEAMYYICKRCWQEVTIIDGETVEHKDSRLNIDPEYMCPNCVTPWKCNEPHIPQGRKQ